MAPREEIIEGVIPIGIEDNTRVGLERIRAEVKRTAAEINNSGATVKIKGDISNLEKAYRDVKLLDKQHAEEVKRLEQEAQATKRYGSREEFARKIKEIELQRQYHRENITGIEREILGLKGQYTAAKALTDEAAAKGREDARNEQQARRSEIERQRDFMAHQKRTEFNDRAALRAIDQQRELMRLQAEYDRRQKEIDARKKLPRSQRDNPSERAQIVLDDKRALLDMAKFKLEAKAIGGKIEEKVELDTSGASNKLKAFMGLGHDSRTVFGALGTAMGGLKDKITGVGDSSGGARANILGMSISMRALATGVTTLSPLIFGLAGGIGSLISVMGAGIAGAAGLGASGLAGFGLAAIGVKAAISGQLQQLGAFKTALSQYQQAQLTVGPAGLKPPTPAQQRTAARQQAQVPLIQQRIGIDQQRVTAAINTYGASSLQAQSATLALATAQQRLSTAQSGVVGTSNKTQKALDRMNMVIQQSDPAMRAAERGWLNLSSTWSKLTGTVAKRDLGQILADGFSAANANVGWFAKSTNKTLDELTVGFHKWFASLSTPEAQHILSNLTGNFNKSLPSIMDGLGHLAAVLGRVLSQFSNYLPNIAKGFDAWASGLDLASKKSDGFAGGVKTMVGAFKSFGEFAGTALRTLLTFFSLGVTPGAHLLDGATASMDRWNTSMQTTGKSKAMDFFKNGAVTLSQFVGLLAPMVGLITKFATALGPALNLALGWAKALADGAAALVQFKPLQYVVGAVALLAVITRLGRGFYEAGRAALGFGANTLRALGQVREKGLKAAFSSNFNMSGADKVLAAHEEGGKAAAQYLERAGVRVSEELYASLMKAGANVSALMNEAMTKAGVNDGNVIASRMDAAGATAGTEMAARIDAAGATAGAEIGTEMKVAGAMSGGLGGLPGGLGKDAKALEGAAGKSGLMKGLGVVGKGLGIAGVGVMGSQLVGGLIPGKAGQAVSNIGSAASIGAGLGSMLGPEGTIAGGVVGGLVGGFLTFFHHHSKDMGKQIANAVTAPMGPAIQQQYSKGIQDATNRANKAQNTANQDVPGRTPGMMPGRFANPNSVTNDQFKKDAFNAAWLWKQAGGKAGAAFVEMFKGASKPADYMFLEEDMKFTLGKMKAKMRPGAAETMLEFANGLRQKGMIPASQFKKIVADLENQVPGLKASLAAQGKDTAKTFAQAMDFKQAQNHLIGTVSLFRARFRDMNLDTKITAANINKNMDQLMLDLRYKMHHGTKAQREEAKAQYKIFQQETDGVFKVMLAQVTQHQSDITGAIHAGTKGAAGIASKNFGVFQDSVFQAMKSGSLSAGAGSNMILKALHKTLDALGQKAPLNLVVEGILGNPGYNPNGRNGYATGGRVPGPVSADTWTLLDPNGQPAGKVGGGEILVANRHTESRVDSMLAQHGTSLSREVNSEGRVHSAPLQRRATGGKIVTASDFGGPSDPSAYMHSTASGKIMDGSLVGYAELSNPPGSLNFSALGHLPMGTMLPVTYGGKTITIPKVDVGAGGPGLNGHVRAIDLTQPAANQLNFPGMADVIVGNPAGINLSSGSGAAAAWKTIPTPKVKGSGPIQDIVRGVMKKVANAANKYGQAHMPKASAQGGVSSLGGGHPEPVVGPPQVQQMITEANAIASHNYNYEWGGGHGSIGVPSPSICGSCHGSGPGIGFDCSGAVSAVIGAAGMLQTPLDSSGFMNWGDPGPGKDVTIYSSPSHVFMQLMGHYFGTSGQNPGGGANWIPGFPGNIGAVTHPHGYARGGRPKAIHKKHGIRLAKEVDWDKVTNDIPFGGGNTLLPGMATGGKCTSCIRKSLTDDHGATDAGEFATGGSFTTTGPTVGLFGEAGPETVIAIPHAATGHNRFRAMAARAKLPASHNTGHKGKSHSKSHVTGGSHHQTLDEQAKAAVQEERIDTQEAAALVKYDRYLEQLGGDAKVHTIGKPGHFGAEHGKGIHKHRTWYPSTIRRAGGISAHQRITLNQLWRNYVELREKDQAGDKGEKAAFATVNDIPAKDRIGGIGTDDIVAALGSAQKEADAWHHQIENRTSKNHKHRPPTAAEKKEDAILQGRVNKLKKMLGSANRYIGNFNSIESELTLLGQYMDNSAATPAGYAYGYDPGMSGDAPKLGKKPVKKTWAEWKTIREFWTKKHTDMLTQAAADVTRIVGKERSPSVTETAWARTLMGSAATAVSDQEALANTANSESLDQYIQGLPYGAVPGGIAGRQGREAVAATKDQKATKGHWQRNRPGTSDWRGHWVPGHGAIKGHPAIPGVSAVANETPSTELARLGYDMSLAQGQVQLDDPGTPQREDIISMGAEDTASKNIMDFYKSVFERVKSDPKHKGDYPLLTSASDAYNSARSNYEGIHTQITGAQASMGPSQYQINDTARANALQQYGSNFSPVAGSPGAAAGGAAAGAATAPGASTPMSGGGNGDTTQSGNQVNVTNNYLHQPADPHTWSQALSWELGAAI